MSQVRAILEPIASLRITVVLFALSMFLIFAGTLAQVEMSNWAVVESYFRSVLVWIELKYLDPTGLLAKSRLAIPFPGGFVLGGLMLINLLAAHAIRFRIKARNKKLVAGVVGVLVSIVMLWQAHLHAFGDFLNLADQTTAHMEAATLFSNVIYTLIGLAGLALMCFAMWLLFGKRDGIVLLHAGIILMLASEGVTAFFALESQMHIFEGQTVAYSSDIRESELAIIDPAPKQVERPGDDWVVAISQSLLLSHAGTNEPIATPDLPFTVTVDRYMRHSDVLRASERFPAQATHGVGASIHVVEKPQVAGTQTDQQANMPSALITLWRGSEKLGTYLVSTWLEQPQYVEVNGRRYALFLRFRRYYKPYTIELLEVRHDKFVGTEMARNFSSRVRLRNEQQKEDREVLIYMNHPLRYNGETFFQSQVRSTRPDTTDGTVLLLVENPGAWMPYYSCLLVTLGMTIHFGRMLFRFAGRALA